MMWLFGKSFPRTNALAIDPPIRANAVRKNTLTNETRVTPINSSPRYIAKRGMRSEKIPNPPLIHLSLRIAPPVLVQFSTCTVLSFINSQNDLLLIML
jgi:hypothetical protein